MADVVPSDAQVPFFGFADEPDSSAQRMDDCAARCRCRCRRRWFRRPRWRARKSYSCRAKVPLSDSVPSPASSVASYSKPRWRVAPLPTLNPFVSRRIRSLFLHLVERARSTRTCRHWYFQPSSTESRLSLSRSASDCWRCSRYSSVVSGGRNPVEALTYSRWSARSPGQRQARRDIVEPVAAIGGPRIQAAARAAGCAVWPRVAVDHVVVVVVVSLIGAQRGGRRDSRCRSGTRARAWRRASRNPRV